MTTIEEGRKKLMELKKEREEKEKRTKKLLWNDPIITEALNNAPMYRRIAVGKFVERQTTLTSSYTGDLKDGYLVQDVFPGDFIVFRRNGRFDFMPRGEFDKVYQPSSKEEGRFVSRDCYKLVQNPTGEYIDMTDQAGTVQKIYDMDIIGCQCDPETGSLLGNYVFNMPNMYLSPDYFEQVET